MHSQMDIQPVIDYVSRDWQLGPVHGIEHWKRVERNGLLLATEDVNVNVVRLFAYLHFVYDIIANTVPYVEWNHNPVFDNISSVFEVMLVFMFVISAVLLFLPEKKDTAI